MSADGQNLLGRIRFISVSGVPRIEAQKGLFLEGPHPDLVEQYVGAQVRFHQREGLIFEDESKSVTIQHLLPDDDPFGGLVSDWENGRISSGNYPPVAPPKAGISPLNWTDYFEIALTWVTDPQLATDRRAILKKLCQLHERLQTIREVVPVWVRSLNRLHDAVAILTVADTPTLKYVLDAYTNEALLSPERLGSSAYSLVRDLILQVAPEY